MKNMVSLNRSGVSVMEKMKRISGFLSGNIGIIVIAFSIIAFFIPTAFIWATPYTSFLLGVAMFGMGLTIKIEDFKFIFKHPKDMLIGCLAQFLIMPVTAYALARIFNLPPDLAIGVILVGCCPGGTASNVITHIAKGDTNLSVGMTTVSTLIAPIITPMLVYLLGGQWVKVSALSMMTSTIKVVLVPILLGIIVHKVLGNKTENISDVMPAVSVVAIVLIICGIVGKNASSLVTCGIAVGIVVMLHNSFGLLLGFMVSKVLRLDTKKSTAIAIEVGMQNSGLAVSLAATNFAMNPLAAVPGAIFSVWHNISGAIFASYMKKKNDN